MFLCFHVNLKHESTKTCIFYVNFPFIAHFFSYGLRAEYGLISTKERQGNSTGTGSSLPALTRDAEAEGLNGGHDVLLDLAGVVQLLRTPHQLWRE